MPYNVPAGLLAFGAGAGGFGGAPGGLGGSFANVLGAIQQGQQQQSQGRDQQLEQMLQIAQFEREVQAAEAAKQQQQAQAQQSAELRQEIPPELQQLFDVDQDTAISRAFPEAPGASDRFRTVGNQLYDISGEQPELAATAPRAPGNPIPVFDPKTQQTRYVSPQEAVGQTPPPKQGITIGPDGTVQIGGQATPLGRKAQGEIETTLINTGERLGRLNEIEARFDPRYLQLGERLGQTVAGWKDKVGLLGEDEQAALADFSGFKQAAFADLNATLKELSGAAVTEQEATRQLAVLPNPGEGVFDGDSPAVFQRKLGNVVQFARSAQARLNYIRTQGLDPGKNFANIKLSQMPGLIDKRGKELEKEFLDQGLPPTTAQQLTDQQLRQEFGL